MGRNIALPCILVFKLSVRHQSYIDSGFLFRRKPFNGVVSGNSVQAGFSVAMGIAFECFPWKTRDQSLFFA